MATSSLTKSFVISSKAEADKLAEMLAKSLKKPFSPKPTSSTSVTTEQLNDFFNKKRK